MRHSTRLCISACTALLFCQTAHADTLMSTPAGGRWVDPATWQVGHVPGTGDIAIITGPVTVDEPVTAGAGTNDAIVLTAKGRGHRFAGFVPGNPALKGADNPDGPAQGWIGPVS